MSVSTSRGAFANESVARIVRPQDVRTGPASWATTWVWYAGAVCARRSRTASVAPRNISMGPATSRTWASSKTTMAIFFMAWKRIWPDSRANCPPRGVRNRTMPHHDAAHHRDPRPSHPRHLVHFGDPRDGGRHDPHGRAAGDPVGAGGNA